MEQERTAWASVVTKLMAGSAAVAPEKQKQPIREEEFRQEARYEGEERFGQEGLEGEAPRDFETLLRRITGEISSTQERVLQLSKDIEFLDVDEISGRPEEAREILRNVSCFVCLFVCLFCVLQSAEKLNLSSLAHPALAPSSLWKVFCAAHQ